MVPLKPQNQVLIVIVLDTEEDAEPTSPDVLRGDTKKGPGISSASGTIISNPTQKVNTSGKKSGRKNGRRSALSSAEGAVDKLGGALYFGERRVRAANTITEGFTAIGTEASAATKR